MRTPWSLFLSREASSVPCSSVDVTTPTLGPDVSTLAVLRMTVGTTNECGTECSCASFEIASRMASGHRSRQGPPDESGESRIPGERRGEGVVPHLVPDLAENMFTRHDLRGSSLGVSGLERPVATISGSTDAVAAERLTAEWCHILYRIVAVVPRGTSSPRRNEPRSVTRSAPRISIYPQPNHACCRVTRDVAVAGLRGANGAATERVL